MNGSTPADFETRDPWHMNAAYGALVLDQLVAWVGKGAESNVA